MKTQSALSTTRDLEQATTHLQFGWMTWTATEKRLLLIFATFEAGGLMTVAIMRMLEWSVEMVRDHNHRNSIVPQQGQSLDQSWLSV